MIKCPNCGSTAQVQWIGNPFERWDGRIGLSYECGCGCCFNILYKYDETEIVKRDE